MGAADRLPGLVGPGQRRAHDRHRAHVARRAARRAAASSDARARRATTSARRTSSGSRATARCSGKEVLDEFRAVTQRRLDALRALTDDDWDREGFTPEGPGPYRQFMAIRVFDCWYHDQDIREALDRPGLSRRSGRRPVARAHPAEGPAVRRREEGGRAAGHDGRVRGRGHAADRRRGARAAGGPRGAARRAAGDADRHARRWTAARSRGSRAVGGTATRRAREGVVRVDGDQELGNRIVDNMAFTL